MCSACDPDEGYEEQDDSYDDDDASLEGNGDPNTLIEKTDDYGLMRMVYTDHDGDELSMISQGYYTGAGSDNIPVFLMTSVQNGKECVIRVPQGVLLEMMDRLGMQLPAGLIA